jgi:hypothetical protein
MTKSNSPTAETKPAPPTGELADDALNQASGGAIVVSTPSQKVSQGSATGMCDGSVRTNTVLIGLL